MEEHSLLAALELARAVRDAQKQYYKSHNRNDLIHSKQLEAKLDAALSQLGVGAELVERHPQQKSLWPFQKERL